ncbi:MAG: acyl carrier protein [Clostridia bacterium]
MKEVTKEKILEIVNTNIENGAITEEQYNNDLSELRMDSIRFIQIIVSLEEEFECEVPDSKLLLTEMNTGNKMYEVLTSIEPDSVG